MIDPNENPILLKPKFTLPKPRKRLTVVMTVQCRDGVVLCADSQESTYWTKESITKILPVSFEGIVSEHCVLGYSGITNYTDLLRGYVAEAIFKREHKDYFDVLRVAVRRFTSSVNEDRREAGYAVKEDYSAFASAIFVGYEPEKGETQVYELIPPYPPHQLLAPYRTAIGTGRMFASSLFGAAEELMLHAGLDWSKLSTKLTSQFCYLALGIITTKDVHSGMGMHFYKVDKTGWTNLNIDDILPRNDFRLPRLLETLLDEVPKDKLLKLVRMYDPNELLLAKLLALFQ